MTYKPRRRVLKDGTVKYDARWRDADGSFLSEAFDTAREAKAFSARMAVEVARAKPGDRTARTKMTLAEYLDVWLEGRVATRVAVGRLQPTTVAGYVSTVESRLIPYLGEHRLIDLDAWTITDAWDQMQLDGKSAKTVANTRGVLSKALADAVTMRLIASNPVGDSESPRRRKSRPQTFKAEERARLLRRLAEHRLGNAFLFSAITGVRASELRGLRWSDLDLDAAVPTYAIEAPIHYIPPQAERIVGESGMVTGDGKTDGAREVTPLAEAAVEVLRAQRRQQAEERLAADRWANEELVFTTSVGTPVAHGTMLETLVRAADAEGLVFPPKQKMQVFRKSFASDFADAGIARHITQRLGRWSDARVMDEVYISSRQKEELTALDHVYPSLDKLLGAE